MKAWSFTGTHQPLVKVEKPEPAVSGDKVKIAVQAAGLCHTDVGVLEDEKWLASIPNLPITMGHEVAGQIEEIGPDVTDFKVGDRVAIWPMLETPGFVIDGGFGEKIVTTQDALVKVPDGMPIELAASTTDAGMTSQGALTRGEIKAGEKVGIIGLGGLGQFAAQLVVLNGAELYVAEIKEDAWDYAKSIGAKRVVKDVTELADENLDLIIDFAGFGTTTAGAIEAVGMNGRVVLVGMGKLEAAINTYPMIIKKVDLRGSNGGTKEDIATVLDWVAKGELKPKIETITWEEIPEGIERLKRGEVSGRLVCVY
nr:zinc-binding dehydrogenase [uncultured Celeribacter sp.]